MDYSVNVYREETVWSSSATTEEFVSQKPTQTSILRNSISRSPTSPSKGSSFRRERKFPENGPTTEFRSSALRRQSSNAGLSYWDVRSIIVWRMHSPTICF